MSDPKLVTQLLKTFGALSLMSIGGANATVPEIHRQIVTQLHLLTDASFAKLIAIGQTSPGPNVLVISMIGWSLAGLLGLLAATVAFIGPSGALALATGRLMTCYEAVGIVARLRKALAPVAVGFMLASGVVMTQAAYAGALSLVIIAGVAALVLLTRVSPFWGIFAGALAGIAAYLVAP
jgi:chromate transporter